MASYTLMSNDKLSINIYIKENKAGKYIIFKGEDKAKEEKLYLTTHIWTLGAGSLKRLVHVLRSAEAEGVENSVKGSLKQRPKSHSGCGAYLAPAPGAQNRY